MNTEDKINFILDVAKNNHGHIGIIKNFYHVYKLDYVAYQRIEIESINVYSDGEIIFTLGGCIRQSELKHGSTGLINHVCNEVLNNRYL